MNDSAIAASGQRKACKDKIMLDGVNRVRMPRGVRRVAVTALAAALLSAAATPPGGPGGGGAAGPPGAPPAAAAAGPPPQP
ncbi:hypothetical protein, partial [Streptosporangium roseum]|uniref:hypothetical protein n=1 Tax=Streptosporangium roseum TaxID=2001 RepID=UPI003333AD6A